MRRLLISMVCLAFLATGAHGQVAIQFVGAPPVTVTYTDFASAVAACTNARMLLTKSWAVTSTVTVPATCEIEFAGAGALNIGFGVVVTIAGGIVAPPQQIFTGVGTVVFPDANTKMTDYWTQWWGAACNIFTDDAPVLNSIIAALPPKGGVIHLCAPSLLDTAATPVVIVTKSISLALPAGAVNITGVINYINVSGAQVYGIGNGYTQGSYFNFVGADSPASAPAIIGLLQSTYVTLRDFSIITSTRLQSGIVIAGLAFFPGSTRSVRDNKIENVIISGVTNELNVGVRYLGGVCFGGANANKVCAPDASGQTFCGTGYCTKDSNNDGNVIEHTLVTNYRGACVSMEHSQAMDQHFHDLNCRSNDAFALCGVAAGRGACTTGAQPGLFCDTNADCVGGTCTKSPSSGGTWTQVGGFMGAHQLADFCPSQSSRPLEIADIASERSQHLDYEGGPTGAIQDSEWHNVRFSVLDAGGAARTCRGSNATSAACATDADCSGGDWCGGCTAARLGVVSSGGVTAVRPCCTGAGTGPECPWVVTKKSAGRLEMHDVHIDTTREPVAFALGSNTGAQTSGALYDSSIYSSASLGHLPDASATFLTSQASEHWTLSDVSITPDKATTWFTANNQTGVQNDLTLTATKYTLATLPNPAIAGKQVYCLNCLSPSSPCSTGGGSGTGALAIGQGSTPIWNCQ